MLTARLTQVGGSVMLAIPKVLLDLLDLRSSQRVEVSVSDGRLIVAPKAKPKYTLEELIAQCDFSLPGTAEDQEWLDDPPVGREVI